MAVAAAVFDVEGLIDGRPRADGLRAVLDDRGLLTSLFEKSGLALAAASSMPRSRPLSSSGR